MIVYYTSNLLYCGTLLYYGTKYNTRTMEIGTMELYDFWRKKNMADNQTTKVWFIIEKTMVIYQNN